MRVVLPQGQSDSISILKFLEEAQSVYSKSPTVREFAVSLCRGLSDNDMTSQVQRLADFVRENVKFIRDPFGAEYIVSPVKMLSDYQDFGQMQGDCDDHALLLNSLIGAIGLRTQFFGVKYGQTSSYNHVISGAEIRGQMFQIDPCAKGDTQPVYNDLLTT